MRELDRSSIPMISDWERGVVRAEAAEREDRCYVQGQPGVRTTAEETLAWWRRCESAALEVRGIASASMRVVWALTLLDVERLAVPVPGLGVTTLRYLVDNGQLLEWSPVAIRRAREDSER